MEKILTIFDRDWEGTRGVVPTLLHNPGDALPTEKLDGTNVRLTVRAETMVRLEARRNPTKEQKHDGITEPWYREAIVGDPADRYLWEAAENTSLHGVPDGEWSAEAVGPKIQGNPLGVEVHRVYFLDLRLPTDVTVPRLRNVPPPPNPGRIVEAGYAYFDREVPDYFDALLTYLRSNSSRVNPNRSMEGIVWHGLSEGFGGKIKRKDFK